MDSSGMVVLSISVFIQELIKYIASPAGLSGFIILMIPHFTLIYHRWVVAQEPRLLRPGCANRRGWSWWFRSWLVIGGEASATVLIAASMIATFLAFDREAYRLPARCLQLGLYLSLVAVYVRLRLSRPPGGPEGSATDPPAPGEDPKRRRRDELWRRVRLRFLRRYWPVLTDLMILVRDVAVYWVPLAWGAASADWDWTECFHFLWFVPLVRHLGSALFALQEFVFVSPWRLGPADRSERDRWWTLKVVGCLVVLDGIVTWSVNEAFGRAGRTLVLLPTTAAAVLFIAWVLSLRHVLLNIRRMVPLGVLLGMVIAYAGALMDEARRGPVPDGAEEPGRVAGGPRALLPPFEAFRRSALSVVGQAPIDGAGPRDLPAFAMAMLAFVAVFWIFGHTLIERINRAVANERFGTDVDLEEYSDHVVVFGYNPLVDSLVAELADRKNRSGVRAVIILSRGDVDPHERWTCRWCHVKTDFAEAEAIRLASVAQARACVFVGDGLGNPDDAAKFRLAAYSVRAENDECAIYCLGAGAEFEGLVCESDSFKTLARVSPIRYEEVVGHLLVHSLRNPGLASIVADLLTFRHNNQLYELDGVSLAPGRSASEAVEHWYATRGQLVVAASGIGPDERIEINVLRDDLDVPREHVASLVVIAEDEPGLLVRRTVPPTGAADRDGNRSGRPSPRRTGRPPARLPADGEHDWVAADCSPGMLEVIRGECRAAFGEGVHVHRFDPSYAPRGEADSPGPHPAGGTAATVPPVRGVPQDEETDLDADTIVAILAADARNVVHVILDSSAHLDSPVPVARRPEGSDPPARPITSPASTDALTLSAADRIEEYTAAEILSRCGRPVGDRLKTVISTIDGKRPAGFWNLVTKGGGATDPKGLVDDFVIGPEISGALLAHAVLQPATLPIMIDLLTAGYGSHIRRLACDMHGAGGDRVATIGPVRVTTRMTVECLCRGLIRAKLIPLALQERGKEPDNILDDKIRKEHLAKRFPRLGDLTAWVIATEPESMHHRGDNI